MKKYYVIISWRRNQPAKMYLVSSKVSASLRGNKNFENPPVGSDAQDGANARLNTAYANRKNGDAAKIELKQASEVVDDMLRQNAAYVNQQAGGDEAMLATSGYDYSNGDPKKSVVPDVPHFLKLTSSKGCVTMRTKRTKGSTGFCWVVFVGGTVSPVNIVNNNIVGPVAANVIIINPGKAREVLKDLVIGTEITVMVLAQSNAGKSAFCTPASIFVNK